MWKFSMGMKAPAKFNSNHGQKKVAPENWCHRSLEMAQ